jgi:hypothetical protein
MNAFRITAQDTLCIPCTRYFVSSYQLPSTVRDHCLNISTIQYFKVDLNIAHIGTALVELAHCGCALGRASGRGGQSVALTGRQPQSPRILLP